MKRIFLTFSIIAVCGLFSAASAQNVYIAPPPYLDTSALIWNSHMMRTLGTELAGNMARAQLAEKGKKTAPKTGNSPVQKNAPVIYSKMMSFAPSAGFVLPRKIAQMQSGNKSTVDLNQMNQLVQYLWGKYEYSFADENRRLKMPFHDVATALTYFIEINYMQASGLNSVESEKSVAIYRQIAALFEQNQEFAKLSNEDKQMLAEVVVTVGGFPTLMFEKNGNAAEKKQAALQNLAKIFGDKAAMLKITDKGIEF